MKIEKLIPWLTANKGKLRVAEVYVPWANQQHELHIVLESPDWAHVTQYADVQEAIDALVDYEKEIGAIMKKKKPGKSR